MASCDAFQIHFTGTAQDLFDKISSLIHQHGGTISGNTSSGTFSVSVPVFGTVTGSYSVVGQVATINITQRSFFLPCSTIESFIKSNIPTVERTPMEALISMPIGAMSYQEGMTTNVLNVPETAEVSAALSQFKALEQSHPVPANLTVPSLQEVCKAYNTLKPYIPVLMPIINKIPVVGNKATTILQTLTTIADFVCPIPSTNIQMANALMSYSPMSSPIGVLRTIALAGISAQKDTEDTNYKSAKISNGYGLVTRAGVSVQRGVTAHVDVKFTIDTVTNNSFKQWLDSQKHNFSKEEWHTLEENYAAGGFLGGVLTGAFGLLFGGGTYNHYKNAHDKTVEADSTEKQGFFKSLSQVQTSLVTIQGSIDAVGTSFIPVEGYVFVETTTIEFNDGKTLTVVNSSSPVVADSTGDTSKISTQPNQKLNIVPIN